LNDEAISVRARIWVDAVNLSLQPQQRPEDRGQDQHVDEQRTAQAAGAAAPQETSRKSTVRRARVERS
jgi:hypothetical protein